VGGPEEQVRKAYYWVQRETYTGTNCALLMGVALCILVELHVMNIVSIEIKLLIIKFAECSASFGLSLRIGLS
jgi:hypothetical protein